MKNPLKRKEKKKKKTTVLKYEIIDIWKGMCLAHLIRQSQQNLMKKNCFQNCSCKTRGFRNKKKLDKAIMRKSSSAQKKIIKRLFQTDSFGKAYGSNARSKPVLFVPDKGDPIAYESMSAMTRVTGLSKARLIGESNFTMRGDIKRSSTAMNKARLIKGLLSVLMILCLLQ